MLPVQSCHAVAFPEIGAAGHADEHAQMLKLSTLSGRAVTDICERLSGLPAFRTQVVQLGLKQRSVRSIGKLGACPLKLA